MRTPSAIPSLFVLALMSPQLGCHDAVVGGNVDGGPGDGTAGTVTQADYAASWAHAMCTKAFACCTAPEIAFEFQIFSPPITTEAQCEPAMTGLLTYAEMQMQASLAAGKIVFDANIAASCVQIEANATCGEFAKDPGGDPCNPFIGQLQVGAACANDNECATMYCPGASTSPVMNGVCATKPTVGQPCVSPDFVCANGLTCDGSTVKCIDAKPDGASCFNATQCASSGCNGADAHTGVMGTCGVPTTCDGL